MDADLECVIIINLTLSQDQRIRFGGANEDENETQNENLFAIPLRLLLWNSNNVHKSTTYAPHTDYILGAANTQFFISVFAQPGQRIPRKASCTPPRGKELPPRKLNWSEHVR